MPLRSSVLRTALATRLSTRMSSTATGKAGRHYALGALLQRHPEDSSLVIYKAESRGETFAVKRARPSHYAGLLRLENLLKGSSRLRVHTDCNEEENLLMYPFYRTTLLALIQDDPDFPVQELQKILRRVGEGLQELHSKDWMHADVKPDNILVNWTDDGQGNKSVTDVVLGDFDIAYQLKDNESIRTPHAQGNVMWRSPEAQTGSGVSKASDVYSFGLVCIFTLGGGDFLIIKSSKALAEKGISAEQEILIRHFCYFGPATKGLLERVHIKEWRDALEELSRHAEKAVEKEPDLKFEAWGEELGPDALDLISGMMKMDPTARLTMDQVLAHRCWVETT